MNCLRKVELPFFQKNFSVHYYYYYSNSIQSTPLHSTPLHSTPLHSTPISSRNHTLDVSLFIFGIIISPACTRQEIQRPLLVDLNSRLGENGAVVNTVLLALCNPQLVCLGQNRHRPVAALLDRTHEVVGVHVRLGAWEIVGELLG